MSDFTKNEFWGAIGGKIDPLADIKNAGIVTGGRVFWVKKTSDADYTTVKDAVGADRMFNDIQLANNAARSDKNDYVLVVPSDSNAVWGTFNGNTGTALVLNKARSHFISTGYSKNWYGYTNTIQGLATASAVDTSVVRVEAPGIEMAGFRVLGTMGTSASGTVSQVLNLGTNATGTAHQFWFHDGAIESNNSTGGANGTLTLVGMVNATGPDGARFENALIGNSTFAGICVALNNIGKRHTFVRSVFLTNSQATADKFVTCGTGVTEFTLFKECEFVNMASGQLPASAVTGSITTTNPFMLSYCNAVNVTALGTDPTVYAAPNQSGTAGAGIHNPGIYLRGSAGLTAA